MADIKRALDTVGHMEKLLDVGNEIHATSNVPLGKYAENDFRPIKIDEEGRVYIDTAALNAIKLLLGEAVDSPEAYTALARLKSLEDKIAAIIAGTSPATVQLYGSKYIENQKRRPGTLGLDTETKVYKYGELGGI